MATKGERQALLFLAAVALLGAGTRVYRARHVSVDTTGIDQQIGAVEQSRLGKGAPRPSRPRKGRTPSAVDTPRVAMRIDLDQASVDEIEQLPGIGPALAQRIIENRNAQGAFGCLVALDGVKGIGPGLLRRLDSLTAFTGPGRPACLSGGGDRRAGSARPAGESRRR